MIAAATSAARLAYSASPRHRSPGADCTVRPGSACSPVSDALGLLLDLLLDRIEAGRIFDF